LVRHYAVLHDIIVVLRMGWIIVHVNFIPLVLIARMFHLGAEASFAVGLHIEAVAIVPPEVAIPQAYLGALG
jgi:hypothetical protein